MDEQQNESTPYKRRVRYSGKNPRHFKDKYKEHNHEKYPDDIKKIIKSGKTPVSTHRPICVTEILDILKPIAGEAGLDATLGFGGHARELLERVKPDGCLYALDLDPIEIIRTEKRLRNLGYTEQQLVVKHSNYAGIHKVVSEMGDTFDFILADLGVSSMQLDNPERGFSFKQKGPLDLRLNPNRGHSAKELIKRLSEKELENIFFENSDEPHAKKIAAIVYKRRGHLHKTTDLSIAIATAFNKKSYKDCTDNEKRSIRRVFQALRITVNDEFSALEHFLRNLPFCLKSKGRVVILSFHSGEDRRVMRFFKQGLQDGFYKDISHEAIRSSSEEQFSNPRSKSALLRWAIKK